MRRSWSARWPCEKLMRATFRPARSICASTPGGSVAGPRVATMRVWRWSVMAAPRGIGEGGEIGRRIDVAEGLWVRCSKIHADPADCVQQFAHAAPAGIKRGFHLRQRGARQQQAGVVVALAVERHPGARIVKRRRQQQALAQIDRQERHVAGHRQQPRRGTGQKSGAQAGQRASVRVRAVGERLEAERAVAVQVAVCTQQQRADLAGEAPGHGLHQGQAVHREQALVDAAQAPAASAGQDQAGDGGRRQL